MGGSGAGERGPEPGACGWYSRWRQAAPDIGRRGLLGYRLQASARYSGLFGGVNISPFISFKHDFDGTTPAPVSTFVEDRKSLSIGLRASYINRITTSLSYTSFFHGGRANLLAGSRLSPVPGELLPVSRILASLMILLASAACPATELSLGDGLTPIGAEQSGNAAGTIPPWMGGLTEPPKSYREGFHETDPFPDDKLLFQINASNAEQYAQHLSPVSWRCWPGTPTPGT